MLVAATGVGVYALVSALVPGLRTGFVDNMVETAALGSVVHFLGGAVVIVLGAFQFNRRFRTRHLHLHRWFGRLYVIGVLIGGVAALYLAFYSFGGVVTHFGFGLLAICWMGTTVSAYRHIRAGDVAVHQQWMIRSYALTLAAVTLRLYLPLFQIAGLSFEESYPVIAWLCWVPNLLVAEWLLVPRAARSGTAGRT
jgi:uncharacterized membrane protein